MNDVNEFLKELKQHRDAVPFPLYCTRLNSGEFEFVNKKFAALLQRDVEAEKLRASDLYEIEADRVRWVATMLKHRNRAVMSPQTFLVGPLDAQEAIRVLDIARYFQGDRHAYTVGILIDADAEWIEWELWKNRANAYRGILDVIELGVHRIDHRGIILDMNKFEQSLLGVDQEWLSKEHHVSELSPDERERPTKKRRVQEKIKVGGRNLTEGGHRAFLNIRTGDIVPVNIQDFAVPEPDPRKVRKERANAELLTVVEDERITPDIISYFQEYGPRNPLLEELGIATFVKVQRRFAHTENPDVDPDRIALTESNSDDLVFTYGNALFVAELVQMTKARPEIGVATTADILGRTDADLWGARAPEYAEADQKVLREAKNDERKEKHPVPGASHGEIDVQVVKIPLFLRDTPDRPVGVMGFYWLFGGADAGRRLTRAMSHGWELLDQVQVPVFVKDKKLRFSYANAAYVKDLMGMRRLKRPVSSLYDVIGHTDRDFFSAEMAAKYETDDSLLITGVKSEIDQIERHGDHLVRVIKTPVKRRTDIVGVQGLFWYPLEEQPLRIDWRPDVPQLHINGSVVSISRTKAWFLFDVLLRNCNEGVSYDQIAQSGLVVKSVETKKDRDNLQQIKARLVEELDRLIYEASLPVDCRIEAEPGGGYRMAVKLRAK